MQVILSHVNTDFDALASLLAAKKLHPEAQIVISDTQDAYVRQFLNIYRDTFHFLSAKDVNWQEVTELILVDIASLKRVGHFSKELDETKLHITVYDHHPVHPEDVEKDAGIVEKVGAAVTLLIEEIKKRGMSLTPLEATLFGLGIYSDTGSFMYKNTTARDFAAASFLMEQGMNLDLIDRFLDQTLRPELQELLDMLYLEATTHEIDGLQIVVSTCYYDKVIGGLATIAAKLQEVRNADAAIIVVGMKKNAFVIGRASSDRITLLPLIKKLGGGGHPHAASATLKKTDYEEVYNDVITQLDIIIKPAVTARDLMTYPVKTIPPETTIEKAGTLMYRYGHSGYPVVEGDKIVGIITRRDLDKANHHGLGHAPVKAYMSTNVITINPATTLEEIQQIVIDHNIGRLPVIEHGKLIGIISRTNIIEAIHRDTLHAIEEEAAPSFEKDNLQEEMKKQLPKSVYQLLQEIGAVAEKQQISAYLIGGIVRDIILARPNDDIDIVVEGNGIQFAKNLQETYGGTVVTHEEFGTATWVHPTGLEIDVASSRLEYYDRPGSLPDVEASTLKEDLDRRDFTINAIAICLNEDRFGTVVDPYHGQNDIYEKKITILHNLSFVEDPTRILRAVRFELRFNFNMDEQTEKLARQSIDKMKDLSVDRIRNDVMRLLKEGKEERALRRLFELHFWEQFGVKKAHEQACSNHAEKLRQFLQDYDRLVPVLKDNVWFLYFIIPFIHEQNWQMVEKFVRTRSEKKFVQEVKKLMNIDLSQLRDVAEIHKTLKDYSQLAILFMVAKESKSDNTLLLTYVEKLSQMPLYITGKTLQEKGLRPGPIFSAFFLQLEIAILEGKVTSTEEAVVFLDQFLATSNRTSN